jgi:hypothetical protein
MIFINNFDVNIYNILSMIFLLLLFNYMYFIVLRQSINQTLFVSFCPTIISLVIYFPPYLPILVFPVPFFKLIP